jgi:hypothetical protein
MAKTKTAAHDLGQPQLIALRDYIASVPALAAKPKTADAAVEIADALDVTATPDYWVYRTFVSADEIYSQPSDAGTSWSWTAFINRVDAERDAWKEMLHLSGGLNPSVANVRTAIGDIFSGATGANQRAFLNAIARRKATIAEKLYAIATVGGVGTRGSTANPDTLTLEGRVSEDDVITARNL